MKLVHLKEKLNTLRNELTTIQIEICGRPGGCSKCFSVCPAKAKEQRIINCRSKIDIINGAH